MISFSQNRLEETFNMHVNRIKLVVHTFRISQFRQRLWELNKNQSTAKKGLVII